jgi:hypothetical protein
MCRMNCLSNILTWLILPGPIRIKLWWPDYLFYLQKLSDPSPTPRNQLVVPKENQEINEPSYEMVGVKITVTNYEQNKSYFWHFFSCWSFIFFSEKIWPELSKQCYNLSCTMCRMNVLSNILTWLILPGPLRIKLFAYISLWDKECVLSFTFLSLRPDLFSWKINIYHHLWSKPP